MSHPHKIITKYDPPPIPDRRNDWSARVEDWDLGCATGWGPTEREAIADLLWQIETDDDELRFETEMKS